MEKGEIAQNEQFHLFPQCFICNSYLKVLNSQISVVVCSFFKFGTVSKWCINDLVNLLPNTSQGNLCWKSFCKKKKMAGNQRFLPSQQKSPFENIEGKGENVGNQHFLIFPPCFLPIPNHISTFQFNLSPANAFIFIPVQKFVVW